MNEAIKLARENGWYGDIEVGEIENGDGHGYEVKELAFLDPLFWQALGRALRWDMEYKAYKCLEHDKNNQHWSFPKFCMDCGKPLVEFKISTDHWRTFAFRFFELRLIGGDEEVYWKELTK